jgi:hypothetical protein
MSTNLKNLEEQENGEKGVLGNQPQLMHITPNALLGSWGQQWIEDMMSLGTDIETHA